MQITDIKKITLDEPISVYDLTVDEYHNFVLANGVVVHNCGGFRKVRLSHQALLPLSGKIMNLGKTKGDKALQSKAIISILAAIGFDPKAQDPLKRLQTGKIVCLADADSDGSHINSLLLTMFYKLMPELFNQGKIFVADMPEFIATPQGQLVTGNSHDDVQAKLKKLKLKADVKHLKGWGEVDPQILKLLAVDPTRKLIRIKPLTKEDSVTFEKVMSEDVDARRETLGIKEEQHS